MDNLKNITKMVFDILSKDPHARDSDDYLYYMICKQKVEAKGIPIESLSFQEAFLHGSEYGLPIFESVRRSRQKLQSEYPDLKSSPEVYKHRHNNERTYKAYARSIV